MRIGVKVGGGRKETRNKTKVAARGSLLYKGWVCRWTPCAAKGEG